jgi:hypothetical protein
MDTIADPQREKPMPKPSSMPPSAPRTVAVAATAAALWLPTFVAAAAGEQTGAAPLVHKHVKKHKKPAALPAAANNEPREAEPPPSPGLPGCPWPYVNQIPPCQSTWPTGDPNFHGSRPGPIPGQ